MGFNTSNTNCGGCCISATTSLQIAGNITKLLGLKHRWQSVIKYCIVVHYLAPLRYSLALTIAVTAPGEFARVLWGKIETAVARTRFPPSRGSSLNPLCISFGSTPVKVSLNRWRAGNLPGRASTTAMTYTRGLGMAAGGFKMSQKAMSVFIMFTRPTNGWQAASKSWTLEGCAVFGCAQPAALCTCMLSCQTRFTLLHKDDRAGPRVSVRENPMHLHDISLLPHHAAHPIASCTALRGCSPTAAPLICCAYCIAFVGCNEQHNNTVAALTDE
jgi:hypothetical protein